MAPPPAPPAFGDKHDPSVGDPTGVEIVHRPDIGILCFRVAPEGFPEEELNKLQEHIYERLMSGGKRTISITKLDDKTVLRLVAVTPRVTRQMLLETVTEARAIAQEHKRSRGEG